VSSRKISGCRSFAADREAGTNDAKYAGVRSLAVVRLLLIDTVLGRWDAHQ